MSTIDPSVLPSLRRAAAACLVSALALGTGSLAWAQEAEVPEELVIDESGWVGNAFLDPEGNFSHCAIARTYDEDMEVLFLMGGEAQVNLIVSRAGFDLEEGAETQVRFRLDSLVDVEIPAPVVAPQSILVRVGNNPDVFEALRRGNAVRLDGEAIGSISIPLSGTLNALPDLRACLDRARQLESEGVDLTQYVEIPAGPQGGQAAQGSGQGSGQDGGQAAGQGAGQGQGAEGPTNEAAIEGLLPDPPPRNLMPARSLVGMMDEAGLPIAAFVAPDRMPRDEMDAAYMWVNESGLTGVLHQRPRGPTVRIDAFAEYYMGIFESVCDGTFELAIGETTVWDDDFAVKTATAECFEEQPDDTRAGDVASVLFALDQANYSAFIHLGRYAQRDEVTLTSNILKDYVLAQAQEQSNQPPPEDPEGDGVAEPPAEEAPPEDESAPQDEPAEPPAEEPAEDEGGAQ